MKTIGLDNGVWVKSKDREITREDLPIGIRYPFESNYGGNVEIVYFRKCYNIRNDVMNHFGWRTTSEDEWQFKLEKPEQVLELIEILEFWLSKKRWKEDGQSIWTYKEIKHSLLSSIINLSIIYGYMISNPQIYLVFYDSY